MLRSLITCLLAAATATAQTQGKDSKKQAPAPSTPAASQSQSPPAGHPTLQKREEQPAAVPPGQAVITVRGLCPAETGAATKPTVPSSSDCVTTVTREQFDNLVKAFNPANQAVPPAARRKLAEAYIELLIYSEAAKSAGVENTPAYAEVMRVLRLKTLSDLYRNQLAEQLRNSSPEEMEAYYKQNESKFESAKLSRIYLPKNSTDPQATAEQKQQYQNKIQHVVDDIQARAAKGGDIAALQKEAYTTLGIGAPPPSTDLSTARHGMFPPKLDQEIFSHKAGEVFRSDDANGFMIYRVESREQAPLESVKEDISRDLFRQKMEEKNKELTGPVHTDLDENYFGPAAVPSAPAARPPMPNPSK
jgi:hypothetical protein